MREGNSKAWEGNGRKEREEAEMGKSLLQRLYGIDAKC